MYGNTHDTRPRRGRASDCDLHLPLVDFLWFWGFRVRFLKKLNGGPDLASHSPTRSKSSRSFTPHRRQQQVRNQNETTKQQVPWQVWLREVYERPGAFDGAVEVDEVYIGGKRANMSNAKRKELEGSGRGPASKATLVGAKNRETGRVQPSAL